ncbi:hypothetical protein [Fodinicola feengrottensis]|uniref:hypothetical protein n=1 Tax=Fodinicola feengrottensis TaxID=435914 RepID=UPI0024431013|nr:hypothetical protein [Fodinicola feengrottensis]
MRSPGSKGSCRVTTPAFWKVSVTGTSIAGVTGCDRSDSTNCWQPDTSWTVLDDGTARPIADGPVGSDGEAESLGAAEPEGAAELDAAADPDGCAPGVPAGRFGLPVGFGVACPFSLGVAEALGSTDADATQPVAGGVAPSSAGASVTFFAYGELAETRVSSVPLELTSTAASGAAPAA